MLLVLLISTFKLLLFSTHKKAAIYDFEINFLCFLFLKVILHLKLLHATLMFNRKYQNINSLYLPSINLENMSTFPSILYQSHDPQKVEKVVLLNHFKNY